MSTAGNAADELGLISAQLNLLRQAKPAAQWRAFRRLEAVCPRCGAPVFEVMNTTPRPVVAFRRSRVDQEGDGRRGAGYWLLDDLPPLLRSDCACTVWVKLPTDLHEWLASGNPKVILTDDGAAQPDTDGHGS